MKTYPLLSLFFLSLFLVFTSCKKEAIVKANFDLNLRDLEVGQKMKYQEIHVDFDLDESDPEKRKDCHYGDKILIVEVMEKTADGFIIKEYLSTQMAEEVGQIALTIKDDQVDVMPLEDKSKYGPSLFHQKTFSIAAVSSPIGELEEDCFYVKSIEEANAENNFAVTNAIIQGASYQNLYAYRFDDLMQVDGPGYTYLFDENAIIIRSTTYGAFFPYLSGWELIPE